MVRILRRLYVQGSHPSQEDKESTAQSLASILEQARSIGHAHASDEEQRGMAWGGKFVNALGSAWDIVNRFVQRIAEWFSGNADATEEDVEAEVVSLAERVGGYEVAAAIEQEIWETLYLAGVPMVVSIAYAGACQPCVDRAEAGPVPINDFDPPPYHSGCRCSTAPAEKEGE